MLHARKDYQRIQDPENKIGENEPVFLFRSTDKLFIGVLTHYVALINRFMPTNSSTKEMLDSIEAHINKVRQWQKANANKVKYPDLPDNPAFIHETFKRKQAEMLDPETVTKLRTEIAYLNNKLKNFSDFNYETAAQQAEKLSEEINKKSGIIFNLERENEGLKETIEELKRFIAYNSKNQNP